MSILRSMTNETPQNQPVPGKSQVPNNAGGFVFQVDDWTRLDRFLVLGVDGGTYYVNARQHAYDNVDVLHRCIKADARRTVDAIVAVSDAGRAPDNDPALFALAVVASTADDEGRRYALANLSKVARIGTHLFHFAQFVDNHRGWGRGLRAAVADWYESKDPDKLAYQAVKYRQRDGWTHRDLLRLSHPKAVWGPHAAIYDFICGREIPEHAPAIIHAFNEVQGASATRAAELVTSHGLPWEALTSEQLKESTVWDALVQSGSLPLGALIRNLGVMTARGVLTGSNLKLVADRLADQDDIARSRLHPIAFLKAIGQYDTGQSRGGVTWTPNVKVVDALDAGFYLAFKNVVPANKRTLVALDVSGSMGMDWGRVAIPGLTARTISAAMSMVTIATEPEVQTVAFSHELTPLTLSKRMRLDSVVSKISGLPFGGTDCALPMIWAKKNKAEFDTFVVYTDNETWYGDVHPFQALTSYRQSSGIDARLIVCGITATEFSIADPDDPGMLDVVGFDTAAPGVMADFSAGRF